METLMYLEEMFICVFPLKGNCCPGRCSDERFLWRGAGFVKIVNHVTNRLPHYNLSMIKEVLRLTLSISVNDDVGFCWFCDAAVLSCLPSPCSDKLLHEQETALSFLKRIRLSNKNIQARSRLSFSGLEQKDLSSSVWSVRLMRLRAEG